METDDEMNAIIKIEELVSQNKPVWDYKWLKAGSKRDRVVAFYTTEYLYSEQVSFILGRVTEDALLILIFNDLLAKQVGHRCMETREGLVFEKMPANERNNLEYNISRTAFVLGHSARDNICFYAQHDKEPPFRPNYTFTKLISETKTDDTKEKCEFKVEDIGEIDIAVDFLHEEIMPDVKPVRYFETLDDLKSYVAVLRARRLLKDRSNVSCVSASLEKYLVFMQEIRDGRHYDPEKGDFTMNELFLDVCYRIYSEPLIRMRDKGLNLARIAETRTR